MAFPKCFSRSCFFVIPMASLAEKRLDIGLEKLVFLKSVSPTVNTYGGIGSDAHVKAESPKTLTVARGSSP